MPQRRSERGGVLQHLPDHVDRSLILERLGILLELLHRCFELYGQSDDPTRPLLNQAVFARFDLNAEGKATATSRGQTAEPIVYLRELGLSVHSAPSRTQRNGGTGQGRTNPGLR